LSSTCTRRWWSAPLAKQREEVFSPGCETPFGERPEQLGLQLLRPQRRQPIRLAVSFQPPAAGVERMKRSRISDIPGLAPEAGEGTARPFSASIDPIQLASPEQIAAARVSVRPMARQVMELLPSDGPRSRPRS